MKEYVSERLKIKEISDTDIDSRLLSWFEDPALMKFYTSSKKKITKKELITSINKGREKGNTFTFLICNNQNDESIGTLKLGPINLAHKTSDLVALIGDKSSVEGKGLGTEAIKLGGKIAFENYDLRKLYGGMYASNIASIKAYTRAGWIVEGVLKGQYLVNGENEDRVLVGFFNPKYFTQQEIEEAKYENWYREN
ncbi:GNAT family N-acetyltransferase [Salibacter halophilus]|uniref:GNAT family N-acetyltransferase n=1 Tax=Salibacter halophilus TaxID=1803916 RepID=A0A6N6M5A6_9FLAO|nr:GNAT family protein [Salibacter halophilus]KAB1063534.1 GNAT family N-acetyltransferase [Salibacter halophilus]